MENEAVSKNFIEQEIDKDLAEGVYDHVCTRFPPGQTGESICILRQIILTRCTSVL